MSDHSQRRRPAVREVPPRSAAGEAFNDVLMLVLSLNGRFTAAGEALAKPAGQSLARWVVLAACQNGPLSVSDIARRLGLARQSVQRIADVLVTDGLCAYRDNPHHQRAKLLEVSAGGLAVLAQIEAAQHQWADALGRRIGEEVLHRAATALAVIAKAVAAADPL
jgi:DNA-binding MarR family transcriptional regulator